MNYHNKAMSAETYWQNTIAKVKPTVALDVVKQDYLNGNVKIVEHAFKCMAKGGGVNSVRFFEESIPKDFQINNIANGRPTTKQAMVLTSIVLQAKIIAVAANEDWKQKASSQTFNNIKTIQGIDNGYMTIYSGSTRLFEEIPLTVFTSDQSVPGSVLNGEFEVNTAQVIEPGQILKAEIYFGNAYTTPADVVFSLMLKGLCSQSA